MFKELVSHGEEGWLKLVRDVTAQYDKLPQLERFLFLVINVTVKSQPRLAYLPLRLILWSYSGVWSSVNAFSRKARLLIIYARKRQGGIWLLSYAYTLELAACCSLAPHLYWTPPFTPKESFRYLRQWWVGEFKFPGSEEPNHTVRLFRLFVRSWHLLVPNLLEL